jgi:hypothetical protein
VQYGASLFTELGAIATCGANLVTVGYVTPVKNACARLDRLALRLFDSSGRNFSACT